MCCFPHNFSTIKLIRDAWYSAVSTRRRHTAHPGSLQYLSCILKMGQKRTTGCKFRGHNLRNKRKNQMHTCYIWVLPYETTICTGMSRHETSRHKPIARNAMNGCKCLYVASTCIACHFARYGHRHKERSVSPAIGHWPGEAEPCLY